MPGKWTVLKSRYAIDDPPWLRLRIDTCRLPNGSQIENFYVYEHSTWACIVALTPDQQVVLVRQYRHGIGRVILELPGGVVDGDEPVLEAARRELLEETGYGGGRWVETGQIMADPATYNNQMHCFLATGVERLRAQRLDETEELEVALMPLAEVIQLARASQMPQAMHVSALFYALSYLGHLNHGPHRTNSDPS
jgi:8-oxo-dGTP pyrophosphatase MutT (NUDIX family)